MSSPIFLVHRPISGDVVGMTAEELMDFVTVPDHAGLVIKVEMAFEADEHECVHDPKHPLVESWDEHR